MKFHNKLAEFSATLLTSVMVLAFLCTFQNTLGAQDLPTLGKEGDLQFHLGPKIKYSQAIGIYQDRPIAYNIANGGLEISGGINKMDESLDPFKISKEKTSSTSYLTPIVKEYRGRDMLLNLGVRKKLSLAFAFQRFQFELGNQSLEADKKSLGAKFNVVEEAEFVELAFDAHLFKYTGLGIKLPLVLTQQADAPQQVKLDNLEADSFRLRFLTSSRFSSNWFGHFYLGYQETTPKYNGSTRYEDQKIFKSQIDHKLIDNILGIGLDWRVYQNWTIFAHVEGQRLQALPKIKNFRASQTSAALLVSYRFNPNWVMTLQGKYFTDSYRQFLPFLVGDATQEILKKPFGFIGLSFTYQGNYVKLKNHFFVDQDS